MLSDQLTGKFDLSITSHMTNKKTSELSFSRYISQQFEMRSKRNPQYSLRAFARDMHISAGNLSKAMNGKRGFSKATLEMIAKRLELNAEEKNLLISLCEKSFAKSKSTKEKAQDRLKQVLKNQSQIALDKVSLIADWYHMGILALADCANFQSKLYWIAGRLGLHEKVALQAIERLLLLKALTKKGDQIRPTGALFIDPKGIPSAAVREFHHQVLKKADLALEEQGIAERDFSSVFFSFDTSKMEAAREKIKKFRHEFESEFGSAEQSTSDEVYCMGLQLFKITKPFEGKTND